MKNFRSLVLGALLSWGAVLANSQPAASQPEEAADAHSAAPTAAPSPAPATAPAESAIAPKAGINLVGQVDASNGEARRNENVVVQALDNNLLKDSNTRVGATTTIIESFNPEQSLFGGEYGRPAAPSAHTPPSPYRGAHGNASWTHQNSVFASRSFFQAGAVQPAHTNEASVSGAVRAWRGGFLTLNARRRDAGGQVNGNILVPPVSARTPLTTDPAAAAIVSSVLNAYPAVDPNRSDISPYALNTNAPQTIFDRQAGGKFDQAFGTRDRAVFSYNYVQQRVDAFQLYAGQNANTTTRSHSAAVTWSREFSAKTLADFTASFNRVTSTLLPDASMIGTSFILGSEFTPIGDNTIPIDRAQNTFRYAARLRQSRGSHELTFGAEIVRQQINGYENNYARGRFAFQREPNVTLLDNIRNARPYEYTLGIGNVNRGFRYYEMQAYAGDIWRASGRLTVRAGVSYRPWTTPVEVNRLTKLPFHSDLNNLAPSVGLAYRLPGRWGALRAAYAVQFGQLYPSTFLQSRFNPPGYVRISIQNPDLVNPLRNVDLTKIGANTRSSIITFAPDLRTPYSNTYDFDWQLPLGGKWTLDLGYVGSRTVALFSAWTMNRAAAVDGIPLTGATMDQRRPDQRYYDNQYVLNGSRAYYDAAKATLRIPAWGRLSSEVSYWFSKAIDLGSDYGGTAAGHDAGDSAGPSQFEVQARMKGVSNFDQPHAFLWRGNYRSPALVDAPRWLRAAMSEWQLDSVFLLKSGTPFTLRVSDGAGYGNVDGAIGDRPNVLDASILGRTIDNPDTSLQMLPRSAFGYIQPGQLSGNLGRNTFRRDGVFNVNLGLSKRWGADRGTSVQLRAETINALNHPQFAEPASNVNTATFGMITNTLNDGRAFRFNLALAW